MDRAEEISRAFLLGNRAWWEKRLYGAEPPPDWPEHAKEEFRAGYGIAKERGDRTWNAKK